MAAHINATLQKVPLPNAKGPTTLPNRLSLYMPDPTFPDEEISAEDMSVLQSSDYTLSVDFNVLMNPERTRKLKAKGHERTKPPRPQNAFMLFRRDYDARVRREHPKLTVTAVSSMARVAWKNAPPEVVKLFRIFQRVAK